ncbi:MAG: sigma-70 family RNA polymerase sigma factor [Candidatus Rokubacteria bacterium]|nr:sigma-70 family RNA polymerase sigma factor [Candidatus Rokubacteria bacterium]
MDLDDRALVERCRGGELAAFEPLVEKYRERVWRLAYNYLHDREDAWDVAQEAFIRAWRALGSFRGQSAFYTWLFRIAVNVAADRARQRAAQGRAFGGERVPEEEMERTMVTETAGPAEAAARAEQRDRIHRALDALPERQRTIIMLSDLQGLTYREIAEVLAIPIGTVMSRLHNARKRLREVLGPLLVLVAVLVAALAAPAPAAAQQIVRFGARVLLASDQPPPTGMRIVPPGPDERLERFVPRLRQLFRYKEYTSIERFRAEVPVGTTQRWAVPGERQLEVTPEAVKDGAVRMRVRLIRGGKDEVATNIQPARGNPAVIGGPKYADGVLIIIVWANANPREH